MKAIKLYSKLIMLTFILWIALSQQIKAQNIDATNKVTVTGQWQFNAPISNSYSDVASGWGMNVGALYNVNNRWSAGPFISWHTNNTYFSRQTLVGYGSTMNMDRQNSLFQLPFGLAGRYKFLTGRFVPYILTQVGTNYSKQRTYSNIYVWEDTNWGFFVSPEIGITFYPFKTMPLGFNVAGYYNYSTNNSDYFGLNHLNNIGFRLGVSLDM